MNKQRRPGFYISLISVSLLSPLLSFLLWDWLCGAKTAYKAEEKVAVFIGAKTLDEPSLQSAIRSSNEGIKEAEIYSCDPEDPLFGTIVSSQGGYSCDLFLLPLGSFDPNIVLTLCAPVETDKAATYFGERPLYTLEGRNYGVLPNEEEKGNLNQFLSFEDEKNSEYVLLFSSSSVNLKGLLGKGMTDHASSAALALLNYGKKE